MYESTQVSSELTVTDQEIVRTSLLDRRSRLRSATAPQAPEVAGLLVAVDAALDRLEHGSFGACRSCDGLVEPGRLMADPLATVCLECLSGDERAALQHDLELASRVQATLLPPRDFSSGQWLGHYRYRPHGTVGGDYVDVLRPKGPESDLIVLLGDVSGKGVAAAMLMSHLHAGVRALAGSDCSLSELLQRANRLLHGASTVNLYATLAAVRLAPNGVAEIATAGHLPVLALHRNQVRHIRTDGLPVGLFGTAEYTTTQASLQPGEALVLYTDGITESVDGGDEELGVSGIEEALLATTDRSPESLVTSVVAAAENHRNGTRSHDDLTVAAIVRHES